MTEGAAGLREMAEAAKKRVKIQKESLKLEKNKYRLDHFSNDKTPAEKRRTFFQLTQDAALKELEEDMGTSTET
jgi:ribosomal protein L35